MNYADFKDLVEKEIDVETMKIFEGKGRSYSDANDYLSNFKKIGAEFGIKPSTVATIYMLKHWYALQAFLRGEYTDTEPIQTRLFDLINYSKLIYGLLVEEGSIKRTNLEIEVAGNADTWELVK